MARRGTTSHKIMILLLVPFFLWVVAFLVLPAASMVISSFQNDGGQGFTLGQYSKVLTHPLYQSAIVNSVVLSLFSSIVAIIIATLAAYSFTTFSTKTRDGMLNFSNLMTNFAGVPLAFGFMVIWGASGMFTLLFEKLGLGFLTFDLYSWTGLALVYIYFQIPLAIMLIYPSLYAIKTEWKEATAILGGGTWHFWTRIGIPVLLPGLVGTLSVLFANAMGAYATAYALVLRNFNMLTIQIGSLVSGDVFPRLELGSALAMVLFIILIIAMLINEKMLKLARKG